MQFQSLSTYYKDPVTINVVSLNPKVGPLDRLFFFLIQYWIYETQDFGRT
jgi:hypothetical protein